VRPYLCVLGHELVSDVPRDGVATFAAALELLHAFLLVHDDIVDRATTRRGEAALHVVLRPEPSRSLSEAERQRLGADLALVAGDWLYTAALEAMLDADLDPAARQWRRRQLQRHAGAIDPRSGRHHKLRDRGQGQPVPRATPAQHRGLQPEPGECFGRGRWVRPANR
jgi:geranylgeranyl pyrophosphate synthase